MGDLSFLEILTLILISGKVFFNFNISWWWCFSPIWIPFFIVAGLALFATIYEVSPVFAFILMIFGAMFLAFII